MPSQWPRFKTPLSSLDSGEPEAYVAAFLDRAAGGRARSEVKVLDVGCGRGDRVAWLLGQGWDAYGADVQYVEPGARFLAERGYGEDRLRSIDGYRLPFEDVAPFDVVLSYQVLEHIPDIDAFLDGIRSIGRPGTVGLHACPGAWRPIEPHMHAPVVHWLPKGRFRRAAIRVALRLGMTIDHFEDRPLDERAEIFAHFSETETFYRSPRALGEAFVRAGHRARFTEAAAQKLQQRLSLPRPVALALGAVYERGWACYILTEQTATAEPSNGAGRPLRALERRRAVGR
jgi:SAM-dependent methyltransferase